ncbi:UNVERIFIED_CONTAM: hypothetical protein HDU68_007080 [Siphonaria sp. JEL0065]|nr:hypothetical protein HDU68_007080 [Siphonaria sp. JEL0065]
MHHYIHQAHFAAPPPTGFQAQQQAPPPPINQQQYYGQQQHQPPPPPQNHTAGQPGTSYQGYVKDLHGWNDPPSLIGSSKKKANAGGGGIDTAQVLKTVENPIAHILVALTTAMDQVKQRVITDPIQRKVLEDTDKRLEELLERLGTQSVPDVIMAHLVILSNAFNAKDIPSATKTTMTLTLMSTEHHDEAHWIVGAKRLVEMYAKTLQPEPVAPVQQQPYQQQQQFMGQQQQQQYGYQR